MQGQDNPARTREQPEQGRHARQPEQFETRPDGGIFQRHAVSPSLGRNRVRESRDFDAVETGIFERPARRLGPFHLGLIIGHQNDATAQLGEDIEA